MFLQESRASCDVSCLVRVRGIVKRELKRLPVLMMQADSALPNVKTHLEALLTLLPKAPTGKL